MRPCFDSSARDNYNAPRRDHPSTAIALLAAPRLFVRRGELFLGVDNPRDPEWEPPKARVPTRPVPGPVRRYRQTHWAFARISWVNVLPPLFYTALTIRGFFTNELWLYLNPIPTRVCFRARMKSHALFSRAKSRALF